MLTPPTTNSSQKHWPSPTLGPTPQSGSSGAGTNAHSIAQRAWHEHKCLVVTQCPPLPTPGLTPQSESSRVGTNARSIVLSDTRAACLFICRYLSISYLWYMCYARDLPHHLSETLSSSLQPCIPGRSASGQHTQTIRVCTNRQIHQGKVMPNKTSLLALPHLKTAP